MEYRQVLDELGQPGAQELLRSAGLARLAYNGLDGFPRVIPVGFWWTGEHVVVCTAPSSPKVPALDERPQVAVTIDAEGPPATALLLRGVAEMDIVDGVPEEFLAASAKAIDPDQMVEFEANSRALYQQMARIVVEPTWARFYDFGAGRLPGFLRRLAAGE